ncbi:hypothetical protein Pst134EA_031990 [Puccinia striiformis f. sp. tritici]|uniref:uncharacterized protein n=1 Tax=Puccinia striiformis f. sp. tritici TaxID=168172 RepID=UPI00200835EF|nr:uncharacterized protein Pst134EA_031990 [Puccinia striiformis f. sp. tritici]KAH9441946.1 hypothetical protein Pst134EA_031990 [Puccinia striiformis f. sp. tritici]
MNIEAGLVSRAPECPKFYNEIKSTAITLSWLGWRRHQVSYYPKLRKASLIDKVKAKAAAGVTPGTTTTSPGGPPIKSKLPKRQDYQASRDSRCTRSSRSLTRGTKTKSAPSSTGGKIKTLDPRNNKPPQRHSAEEVRAFMDKYGIKDSTVSPNFGISNTTPTGTGGYNSNITPTGTGGYNSNITPTGTGGYNSNTTPTGTGGYSKPSTGNLKSQTGYDRPPSNTTPTELEDLSSLQQEIPSPKQDMTSHHQSQLPTPPELEEMLSL